MTILPYDKDPWIFFRDKPGPVDQSKVVGLFMPCYNNAGIVDGAVDSLVAGMPEGYPFGLVFMDAGSTDGTLDRIRTRPFPVLGPYPLGTKSHRFNAAAEQWLGKWDGSKFQNQERVGYLGFIHTDAVYNIQVGWLKVLTDLCEADPKVGCVGPWHSPVPPVGTEEYSWNPPLFIVPVRVIVESYRRYGWWIDPVYWDGVSFCDWDMHRRFMGEMGLKTLICKRSRIIHTGVGSRNTLSRTPEWQKRDADNRQHHNARWKTEHHPWEK